MNSSIIFDRLVLRSWGSLALHHYLVEHLVDLALVAVPVWEQFTGQFEFILLLVVAHPHQGLKPRLL